MDKLLLKDEHTENILLTMLQNETLVPVIGAGFSAGAKTKSACVPAKDEFRVIMLEALRKTLGNDIDYLKDSSFLDVAEHFLNNKFVDSSVFKQTIRTYFTDVMISGDLKSFLNCPWPYIYTLNIDDAIEKNSRYSNVILPNRNISESAKSLSCVYKVHGDAVDSLLYDEPSKIIFSTPAYIKSLITNLSMLNSLKTDLIEHNTIFVGCSLKQEIDLLYALADYTRAFPAGRRSIFVTTEQPNIFVEEKLQSHGINTILIVDDYPSFYATLARLGSKARTQKVDLISNYKTKKNNQDGRLDKDKNKNLSFLFRDARREDSNTILPDYYVHRDMEHQILKAINKTEIILLRGRRFSGKTLMLRNVSLSSIARNVYFFDSNASISIDVIDELLLIKNGLFVFDTNALSEESAIYIKKHLSKVRFNNSTIIVAMNRTESGIFGILSSRIEDEYDFELQTKFSSFECDNLNNNLDAMGIMRFNCKKTILENVFILYDRYGQNKTDLILNVDLSEKEVELLLVIAVFDKAFSNLATALDIRSDDLNNLCEKLAPMIEIVDSSMSEMKFTHSKRKIISNSVTGISFQLQYIIRIKGSEWLMSRFYNIVARLKDLKIFSAIGHGIYMFDAINHVLAVASDRAKIGYRPVVMTLYENLQPLLNQTADYWLQRSKAILKLNNKKESILDGIDFALKALNEAGRERTMDNAEFTIALLYGKLCAVTMFKESKYILLAVTWFAKATRNYGRNFRYINSMLDLENDMAIKYNRKGYFFQLCDFLEGPLHDIKFLEVKADVAYLIDLRNNIYKRQIISG